MCMKSKHLFIMMTVLSFSVFLAVAEAQVGIVSKEDPEMVELQKEQMRMMLEVEKAQMEMRQAEASRAQQFTRYFGYSYFIGAGAQTVVSENLPVPANYVLGAGDQIAITFWGTTRFEKQPVPDNYILATGDQLRVTLWGDSKLQTGITIDRDGRYFANDIDKWVYLSGKTLEEAEQDLRQEFQEAYVTLKGPKPTTFMDVTLGAPTSMNSGTYVIDRNGRIFVTDFDEWLSLSGKTLGESKVLLKSRYEQYYPTLREPKATTYMDVTLGAPTSMNSGTYVIDRDGRIFVTDFDEWLFLSGKTLEESKVLLKSRYEQYYPTLREPKATTYMDVTVGTLKSINVQLVGEVTTPGIYTIHPFSSVGNGVTAAGGITINGSLRDIRVLRKGEAVNIVDYYKLFLKGQSEKDFRLLDQDIILVPIRKSTVEISGEVYRPGVYEMLPGEYIDQLISYAGGLKPTAASKVELKRITERGERESDDDAVTVSYLDVEFLNPHEVLDGDDIWIKNIMEVSRQVFVSGQVKRPGAYAYTDSLRLLDLLEMAGGIRDEDYLKSINLGKLDITRRNIDSDYSNIIVLKLADVINGNGDDNILLKNHDQVTIYPNRKYFPAKTVTINGEVFLPGVFSIQKDFETLGSIITRAGGFTARAFEEGLVVERSGLRLVIEGLHNTVAEGDIITIPEKTDVVEVDGAVYNPGLVSYKRGRGVNQYIRIAGGLMPNALKNDILVIYANGSVKARKYYIYPRLRPGAKIMVTPRISATPIVLVFRFLTDVTSNITQLLASYILITQIGDIIR